MRLNGDSRIRGEYHASEVRRRLEELSRGIAVAIDIRSGSHVSIDIRVAPLLLREKEKKKKEQSMTPMTPFHRDSCERKI